MYSIRRIRRFTLIILGVIAAMMYGAVTLILCAAIDAAYNGYTS